MAIITPLHPRHLVSKLLLGKKFLPSASTSSIPAAATVVAAGIFKLGHLDMFREGLFHTAVKRRNKQVAGENKAHEETGDCPPPLPAQQQKFLQDNTATLDKTSFSWILSNTFSPSGFLWVVFLVLVFFGVGVVCLVWWFFLTVPWVKSIPNTHPSPFKLNCFPGSSTNHCCERVKTSS